MGHGRAEKQTFQVEAECSRCAGSGLYVGLAEMDGAAIQCNTCQGTGQKLLVVEYRPFTERQPKEGVLRVFQCNPGVGIGTGGGKYKLSDFGGQPHSDWEAGQAFSNGSEMRSCTCPAWWTQCTNNKWDRPECGLGCFSACSLFDRKDECWALYDTQTQESG